MRTTFVILAIIDVLLWTWLAFQLFAGLKKMTILNSEQRLISEQVKTGRVTWRGTEYPVETLKRNVV
jgi:hypothetical protein